MNVSAETQKRVDAIAREVAGACVAGYRFDGQSLKPLPAVSIRDAIISHIAEPGQLLRLQLVAGEEGQDDRWKAAAEMLLGGGIEHQGRRYRIMGAGSSLKGGHVWMATDDLRQRLHRYFSSAQEALSYLGIFFSGCPHGIHRLEDVSGIVVTSGEEGTADGMGFISLGLLNRLKLPERQIQVRIVGEGWIAKGTLIPREMQQDLLLPTSMIKGGGRPEVANWSVWFGIRDIAEARPYSSSFTFAQWFEQKVFDALSPVVEDQLRIMEKALCDRTSALQFLGLIRQDEELIEARTKLEAFLQAGVDPDHPWLHRQLTRLIRKSYVKLAMGGGFELEGRMGAWGNLPPGTVCASGLPEGPLVLSRYPIRDPISLQPVWNQPDAIAGPLPGTIYLGEDLAKTLDGDYDGDFYITCSQEAVVDAVTSKDWYPDYERQDAALKVRNNDPLTLLPFVVVQAIGNRIGTITYAIAGAVEKRQLERVAELSASLQAEVQSLKWDTRGRSSLIESTFLEIPDYLSQSKQDRSLFVTHAEPIAGDSPLVRNYNRVVAGWKQTAEKKRLLLHFKMLAPLWLEPAALNYVEEATAMVQMYNRWVASILIKHPEPSQEELAAPIEMLASWDASKEEDRMAWGIALWHAVHSSRVVGTTGSAAFHAFGEELTAIIAAQTNGRKLGVPIRRNRDTTEVPDLLHTVPLVGAIQQLPQIGDLREKLNQLSQPATVTTRQNGDINAAFFAGELYLGQVPKDHLLYGSIPLGLGFEARLQMRGRTIYMVPSASDWLSAIQQEEDMQ